MAAAEIDWSILGPALGELAAITIAGIWTFRHIARNERRSREQRRTTRPLWQRNRQRHTQPLQ